MLTVLQASLTFKICRREGFEHQCQVCRVLGRRKGSRLETVRVGRRNLEGGMDRRIRTCGSGGRKGNFARAHAIWREEWIDQFARAVRGVARATSHVRMQSGGRNGSTNSHVRFVGSRGQLRTCACNLEGGMDDEEEWMTHDITTSNSHVRNLEGGMDRRIRTCGSSEDRNGDLPSSLQTRSTSTLPLAESTLPERNAYWSQ